MNGNLFELLRSRYERAAEQPFLVLPDGPTLTYADVDDRAGRYATALRTLGVAPGDRVVVQIPKSTDAVALYLACLQAGAVIVPLNTAYTPAEVQYFVDDARPAVFVGAPDDLRDVRTVTAADLAAAADGSEPHRSVTTRLAEDLAAMLYTSGTTGRSKGAMLTHANLASNGLSLHRIWGFEPGDVLLHVLPIFHVHGLFVALHTAMLNASPVIFHERFSVEAVLDSLPRATVMMGVPTHYVRLLDDDRLGPHTCVNMRLFTSGSAPMTERVHHEFTARTGHRILERYGMTEAGMITSNPYEGDRVPGTVGFPLPGVDLRVRRADGERCPPGEPGVVEIRGPNVFSGYWRQPEKTAEVLTADAYFVTGDIGSIDDEGRLSLQGRETDMIISGGLNVYPREVELVLDELPGVGESAVIGLPDDDLGEIVVAVVVPSTASGVDRAALEAALSDRIARFKRPQRIELVDELPRNAMGKVQKGILRSRFG